VGERAWTRGRLALLTMLTLAATKGNGAPRGTFQREGKQCRLASSWQTRRRSLGLMCDANRRCPALHCPLYPQTNAHRSVINLSGACILSPHPSTPLGRQKAERSHVKVFGQSLALAPTRASALTPSTTCACRIARLVGFLSRPRGRWRRSGLARQWSSTGRSWCARRCRARLLERAVLGPARLLRTVLV